MERLTCPHSPHRTCNGGLNSCIECPKVKTYRGSLIGWLLGIILALVFLALLAGCVASGIERYTYVRPGWAHANGLRQCPAYHSTKPVKRSHYRRVQMFNRELAKQ